MGRKDRLKASFARFVRRTEAEGPLSEGGIEHVLSTTAPLGKSSYAETKASETRAGEAKDYRTRGLTSPLKRIEGEYESLADRQSDSDTSIGKYGGFTSTAGSQHTSPSQSLRSLSTVSSNGGKGRKWSVQSDHESKYDPVDEFDHAIYHREKNDFLVKEIEIEEEDTTYYDDDEDEALYWIPHAGSRYMPKLARRVFPLHRRSFSVPNPRQPPSFTFVDETLHASESIGGSTADSRAREDGPSATDTDRTFAWTFEFRRDIARGIRLDFKQHPKVKQSYATHILTHPHTHSHTSTQTY